MEIFKKKNLNALAKLFFVIFLFVFLLLFLFSSSISALEPTGPDSITISNETKAATTATMVNVSGGYISTINITATTQNPRWKGMVGQLIGTFTLDDASGSTLYDWTLTSVGGEVYATRNSTSPTWANIKCTNASLLENENLLMNHTSSSDNITATFNTSAGATHAQFVTASNTMAANTCPTLNTYKNNATQDTDFEEVALTDSTNFTNGGTIIYTTILENNIAGFDSQTYDFQMIVPENGLSTWTGATAYYLYVELS